MSPPGPKPEKCQFGKDNPGSCGKQSGCKFDSCSLCCRHCNCNAVVPRTPRPTRSNRAATNENIARAVVNQTPVQIKAEDVDYRSLKDFFQVVPRRPELIERLHDGIRITVTKSASVWTAFVSYGVDVLNKLAETVADRASVSEVKHKLIDGIANRFCDARKQQTAIEIRRKKMIDSMLSVARKIPSKSHIAKSIRAFVVSFFSEKLLDALQDDVPKTERLVYSKRAQTAGRRYYQMLLEDQVDMALLEKAEEKRSLSRMSDSTISDAVSFIAGKCQLNSWGEKRVPLGKGETIMIPRLTRTMGIMAMWDEYEEEKEQSKSSFSRILGVRGPIKSHDTQYKGSIYNLRILWDDGETTMEPLASIMLDDPVTCVEYAVRHDFLKKEGWKRLASFVENGKIKNDRKATLLAFKGGRQMMGRTSFTTLAKVLTGGDEKLVRAVDYVKGVLIHDVVDVLQQIIDDQITDKSAREDLTRGLTILSNFLKNQFKNHVLRDENWDTHGAQRGLLVPPQYFDRPIHYSFMSSDDLDDLIKQRGIRFAKRNPSRKAKIEELDDYDLASNEVANEEGVADLGDTRTGVPRGREANGNSQSPPVNLERKTMDELRELVGKYDIGIKGRSKKKLIEAIASHRERELSAGDIENTTPDGVTSGCNGCAYLHWFMLERLPDAVKAERTIENSESIENALEFMKHAHEKFVLYQGHQVRVTNQNKQLETYDQELRKACRRDKNTTALQIWLVVDFKMKWEPMYQREKSLENYGKRGISWHGNRAHFYVWDSTIGEPVKKVIKLDQIIDGNNKQDGGTVLALLEACLVFLMKSFPGADVAFLQSDNAACYHVKDLVVGIPQVNANMQRKGGPVIKNFVHTETQDGKSLLDAHFAHATALLKRYLRRVRKNRINKLTSPSELVDGLCALGGLQNCGAQLISHDDDVEKALAGFSKRIEKVSNKLKIYFSRANEINYFPDTDSSDGKCFDIHVTAYSGIGSGLRIHVDVDKNHVKVAEDDPSAESENIAEPDGIWDAEEGMYGKEEDEIEEEDEDDADDPDAVLDMFLDESIDCKVIATKEQKKLKSTNGMKEYSAENMITSVKVEKFMRVGKVLTTKESSKRQEKKKSQVPPSGTLTTERNLIERGLRMFVAGAYNEFGIRDGRDENVAEYDNAEDFVILQEHRKFQGWARRPERGEMYGEKYIGRYKEEIIEMYKRGSSNKERKMGPSSMIEQLRRNHPGVYTLPNFSEIQSFISQCFAKEKNKQKNGNKDGADVEEREHGKDSSLPLNLSNAVIATTAHYGGKIKPGSVVYRLTKQFPDIDVGSHKASITSFASKKNKEWSTKKQRVLIG